jgi:hypothetical protein
MELTRSSSAEGGVCSRSSLLPLLARKRGSQCHQQWRAVWRSSDPQWLPARAVSLSTLHAGDRKERQARCPVPLHALVRAHTPYLARFFGPASPRPPLPLSVAQLCLQSCLPHRQYPCLPRSFPPPRSGNWLHNRPGFGSASRRERPRILVHLARI